MNIYQGETIDMIMRFRNDDGLTPADLTGANVSVAIKDISGRMVCGYTTFRTGSYGDIEIMDNSNMRLRLSEIDTKKLYGDYVAEIKISMDNIVMIEQTPTITVKPSAIGKEIGL